MAKWGGILGVKSLGYAVAHGISPSTAIIVCGPRPSPPDLEGDLTFGVAANGELPPDPPDPDDPPDPRNRLITLKHCLLDVLRSNTSGGGSLWMLAVLDRRWRWGLGPPAVGHYNQVDAHGKLIPRTVRSPYQLCHELLTKMGEADFADRLDLPAGLTHAPTRRAPRPSRPWGRGTWWSTQSPSI